MFENIEAFRMSTALAKHAGKTQATVAQNIANADTPGYVARDMPAFKSVYAAPDSGATLRASRAKHLHGTFAGAGTAQPFEVNSQASPNDNQVSLETEMLKSVGAKRQHDRALAIYKTALSVIRSTLRPS